MGFAQEPLPPMLEKIVNEIDGTITHKEFKDLFYKVRMTSSDIQFYKKYLKERNIITVGKKTITKEENNIHEIIILKCHECGYEWNYKGKNKRAKCPYCKYRKKTVWIKIVPQI